MIAFTQPNEQWSLERELRRQTHSVFLKEENSTQNIFMADPMKR